ncbi:MAG: histidinol dehydrogenase [Alphaproteobacteria bacterium]|nr:histidinol dehydrogenase [Alphaproteobacteria bacterium]
MPVELTTTDTNFEAAFAAFLAVRREPDDDVSEIVAAIIAQVKQRGDDAVIDYTRQFDRHELRPETLAVTSDEIATAVTKCDPAALQALVLASTRIREFHTHQKPASLSYTDSAGVLLGYRWTAVAAVGLYVPGGTASYPSSVLMNAVPAKVAGVPRLVMVVPTPDGVLNPLVLAAAKIAGVDEIYRIGGAQAIAALAHGTATIAPVDKIVGPGNAYVAAAKRQVFGIVGIDTIAGPSEILVVADGANDPSWIAADLLAQAEHDPSAQSILITDDRTFAERVVATVHEQLATLPRAPIARASWENHGAIIIVNSMDQAIPLIDRIAPEHLELAIEHPGAFAARVHNAGAIFLGRHTPEALGDYVAGPNHVLPTGRSARFASGLSVLDFVKRSTVLACDPQSLQAIGPAAATLAEAEGLHAHQRSVLLRTPVPPNPQPSPQPGTS